MIKLALIISICFLVLALPLVPKSHAYDKDPNDRFTDPPVNKVVVRPDNNTEKLDVFIAVDTVIWVPKQDSGFSTNQEGVYDYDD